MAISLADARQKITEPHAQPIRIFAAGARAAVIRSFGQTDHHPPAASPAGQLLVAAADHLGVLRDLIATHLRAGPAQRGQRLYTPRDAEPHHLPATGQLTAAGRAIARGVQRQQVVGELAQIARSWVAVDRVLADPAGPAAAHLPPAVAQRLHAWLHSPFGGLFDDYATIDRSSILRTLDVATDPARPAGPRPIATVADARRTLSDITTALTRDPQQATVRLAGALVRLGYVAQIRAANAQPGDDTRAQLAAWKDLVLRLDQLRHLRDQQRPELADETNQATAWLIRQPPPAHGAIEPGDDLRPAVADALRHTATPLRRALAGHEILAPTWEISGAAHKGVHLAEQAWTTTDYRNATALDAVYHLADVAREHRQLADTTPVPARDIERSAEEHRSAINDSTAPDRPPSPTTARPGRPAEPVGLEM